jgi:hypothetical protein
METDHIYPENLVKRLPGFDLLTPDQKYAVMNYPSNFQPLPKSLNSSKKDKTALKWQSALGQSFHPDYIGDAIKFEQQIKEMLVNEINRHIIQNQISAGLKMGSGGGRR